MRPAAGSLKKEVRLIDIVTLGAGATVGVAIFSIFGPAAQLAGTGMLISLALAAIPMIVFAVVYAFMGSAVPLSGASFEWPTRFVHPFAGFMISWLRILGSTGVMVVLALVLVQHWSMVLNVPLKATMFAVFLTFFVLNLLGIALAARAQTLLFGSLTVALAIFVAAGLQHVEPANFIPLPSNGWKGVLVATPLLVSLYLGIEAATEVGEEVRDAKKTISRGIGICVGVILVIYACVSVVTLGTLGPDALAQSKTPLLDVAGRLFGGPAELFIIVAATLAIAKSLNAIMMIFSRYLFAMGRTGVLPSALAKIHPRWGTPWVAITTVFACCVLGLFLPTSLTFLFLAINIPTMLKYLGTCLSALRVVTAHPDLYERAGFRPRRDAVKRWATAGVLCAVGIVVAGFSADWRPYAIFAVWGMLGTAYWFARPTLREHVAKAG